MPKRKTTSRAETVQNGKESQDNNSINRNMLLATWAGAIASIIAVVSGIAFFVIAQNTEKETFSITSVQRITISHTQITPFSYPLISTQGANDSTGILSSYWKVFLSNNSDKDISIIKYNLLEASDNVNAAISYSHMDQGLYTVEENDVKPLLLPITIQSGETIPVVIKIGVIMNPDVYRLVINKFAEQEDYEMQDIETFLRKEHETDIYGNRIKQTVAGIWEYPSFDTIKEQVFGFSFETARGTQSTGLASWYVYSGYFSQYTQP